MFKIGEIVVYPAHGACTIDAIESKSISGDTHDFFVLTILGSDMTIMVPVANADMVGMRCLIDKGTIPKVYAILKEKNVVLNNQTWNRRYREYMEKIKTGSVIEIANVLRELCLLQTDKELSFGERKMMDTAKNLLITEFSLVADIAQAKVEEELNSILNS